MHIVSRDNPKIKKFLKLQSSKKMRQNEGLFVLEGARLCADAFDEHRNGKLQIYCAFASQNALEKYSQFIDVTLFDNQKSDVFFTLDDSLADKISDTKTSQGVFIIAYLPDNSFDSSKIKSDGKYAVLNNLQDPGNVGTILRTADAVGVDGVVLSNNCCDLYNPKVLRSTMGSLFRLNIFVADDFSDVCDCFKSKNVKVLATVVDKDATSLTDVDFSGGCAVVIGNEGNGLSGQDVSLCDEKITIKMNGNINSLNAGMAAGIILWEMSGKK